ncbi:MAG: glycoside hydrolase family 30 protein [Spirochaetales bacterium]|nr:glycoside hydrolase family 30 protein [Spirochaetales bacterium]
MIREIVTIKHTDDRLMAKKSKKADPERAYYESAEVDPAREYQTMIGFGGAFTEAAAVTLAKMSPDLRSQVIEKYYDKEKGLGYNLGRVPIHSCDFALGNYTYVENGDSSLKTFNIDHDRELIIPLIKDAIRQSGKNIQILASPWSPPAWMKTNNSMNNGGSLLPAYFSSWANYYINFIAAYEEAGVPIWGLTVQNEPAAVQTWDSCIYTEEEERDFVKYHLGPALHRAGYTDIKLLIWDHNRDLIVKRAKTVLEDPEAARYIWGTGFHWYVSEAFENVGQVHDLFPDKHLLFTEGCQEGGVKKGEWFTGERYGRNMIGDINNWCEGYLDWNIVLDETGGPNHVNNLCDAPVIYDTKTNDIFYNSSYYYIGHFSKFIVPGAKRLFSDCSVDKISIASFKNPDGKVVIVIMNEDDISKDISIRIQSGFLNVNLEAHSIYTYIVD